MLESQALLGTLIIIPMVVIHVFALVGMAEIVDQVKAMGAFRSVRLENTTIMSVTVLVILVVHMIEAWVWAAVYYSLDEFTDLENAIYFSVVTATTLGYGDITLSEQWQLLGSLEAMSGLISFGVSVAFLIEVMRLFFRSEPDRA